MMVLGKEWAKFYGPIDVLHEEWAHEKKWGSTCVQILPTTRFNDYDYIIYENNKYFIFKWNRTRKY